MCIDRKEKINRIDTHAIWYNGILKGDEVEVTAEFRTHAKYSKRLYYVFKPFWYLLHGWDMAFGKKPEWNFGFDTLTAYPDADAESTTVDGAITYAPGNHTWATVRGAVTGSVALPSIADVSFGYLESSATSARWAAMRRSFFLFDLASISGATVSAVTLSLYGSAKSDSLAITPDLDIVSSNPASNTNLVTADYDLLGTTVFGSVSYAGFSTSAYNDITLDASGIAQATPGGIAKYGGRLSPDTDNAEPTWSASKVSNIQGYYADETGTTKDPKLTVTYSTSAIQSIGGLAKASVASVGGLAIGSMGSIGGLA